MRVLLVEDNETDRWFFAEILRSRGYTVVATASGEEAAVALAEATPDLALLDLDLPGIDGLEVCRRVRSQEDGERTLILVVTARDEPGGLNEVLEAGADDFLKKPIEPSALAVRLDIAERRIQQNRAYDEARHALASKRRELETLFANLQDVSFSVDIEGDRLIQVSPSCERIFGVTSERLMEEAELWKRFLLPADGDEDPWAELREGSAGGAFVREYAVALPGGATVWVRASTQVHDGEGGGLRADGLVVDITHEHEARKELAARNQELAALYRLAELTLTADSLEEAYNRILDLVADVTGCPIVAIEHLDRDKDRLVVTAARGIPSADDEPLVIPLRHTLSGVAISTGEPLLETNPGSRPEHRHEAFVDLGLEAYAAFPLTAAHEAFGTLLLANTEPMEFTERFERLGRNLATTIATHVERMEAEDALRESESRHRLMATQLQQANAELESFAYSCSHDLRAPLRTMQGFAHALLQNYADELPEDARDYARRIIASGQQSENLISDLLDYSRLSFERVELNAVELSAVVETAREQVRADLDDADAEVSVEDELPEVRGNLTTLVQVVANLLSNAVKFAREDTKPEVLIHAEEAEDDHIRLWVEDNGIGVPEGQEERIFKVFERLSEGGNRPGTGIGLAIVRRGLERIGGRCGVARRPEGGSAFWIELPKERRVAWRPWRSRK
jgi:PAS domain S-box-containing protein